MENLPHEMIISIVQFCDPRSLVNIICTCKRLRKITIQVLLMGRRGDECNIVEGVTIRNSVYRHAEALTSTFKLPSKILDSYLNFLMSHKSLDMDRINLMGFNDIGREQFNKVSKIIEKYHISELIVHCNTDSVGWINREMLSSLKGLKKLRIVDQFYSPFISTTISFLKKIPTFPMTVLEGIYLEMASDVDNFCKETSLCHSLQVLTLLVPQSSVFEYAFRNILKNCTNLKEFNLFVSFNYVNLSRSLYTAGHIEMNVDLELVEIMKCSKLEILRLDSIYEVPLTINNTSMNRNIFPNLKIYSNNISAQETTFNPALVPNHPLDKISIYNPSNTKLVFPKCDSCYLHNSLNVNIPDINTRKLTVNQGRLEFYDKGLNDYLSPMTDLKELVLRDVHISFHEDVLKLDTKNTLELLTIEKCTVESDFLIHLLDNSPHLKEIIFKKLKAVDARQLLDNREINIDSQLRSIQFIDCNHSYPKILKHIAKYNLPHLHTIVLENAYSVGKEIVHDFFIKGKSLSNVRISGAEFDDCLIEKFLKWFQQSPSKKYGFDLSFSGKQITANFLSGLSMVDQATTISLPDCVIENNEFIELMDKLNREVITKIHINLGETGPSIEALKKLEEFTSLQMIFIKGKPKEKIEGFESYILNDFITRIPNLHLLYLEYGEFDNETIEMSKIKIRSMGRSAPKLVLSHSLKNVAYNTDQNSYSNRGSVCLII